MAPFSLLALIACSWASAVATSTVTATTGAAATGTTAMATTGAAATGTTAMATTGAAATGTTAMATTGAAATGTTAMATTGAMATGTTAAATTGAAATGTTAINAMTTAGAAPTTMAPPPPKPVTAFTTALAVNASSFDKDVFFEAIKNLTGASSDDIELLVEFAITCNYVFPASVKAFDEALARKLVAAMAGTNESKVTDVEITAATARRLAEGQQVEATITETDGAVAATIESRVVNESLLVEQVLKVANQTVNRTDLTVEKSTKVTVTTRVTASTEAPIQVPTANEIGGSLTGSLANLQPEVEAITTIAPPKASTQAGTTAPPKASTQAGTSLGGTGTAMPGTTGATSPQDGTTAPAPANTTANPEPAPSPTNGARRHHVRSAVGLALAGVGIGFAASTV